MTTRLLTIASSAAIALASSTTAQAAQTSSVGGDASTAYTILAGMVAIAVLLGISAYSSERRKH